MIWARVMAADSEATSTSRIRLLEADRLFEVVCRLFMVWVSEFCEAPSAARLDTMEAMTPSTPVMSACALATVCPEAPPKFVMAVCRAWEAGARFEARIWALKKGADSLWFAFAPTWNCAEPPVPRVDTLPAVCRSAAVPADVVAPAAETEQQTTKVEKSNVWAWP